MTWRLELLSENPQRVRAREMVIALAGHRPFGETRGSQLHKLAERLAITPRRIKALFYQEPLRLREREYAAIERAYEDSRAAMAALSDLASAANLQADRHASAATASRSERR